MHGLVAWQPWTVLERGGRPRPPSARSSSRTRAIPSGSAVAVDYALGPDRLAVTMRVRNVGTAAAPVGVGMHPYLHVGAHEDGGIGGAELDRSRPDGAGDRGRRCPPACSTGSTATSAGSAHRAFDTPLTDLERDDDGWARLRLRGPIGRARARRRRVLALAAGLHAATDCRRASGGAASPSSR